MLFRSRLNISGMLAEVVKGYQDYYGNGDNTIVDGMFTALEIEIETRRSQQAPTPQYRADLVTFVNAAKAGLWDPKWEPSFKPGQLAAIQKAWQASYLTEAEKAALPAPDLESDGPEGEWEK